jgi:uncharacterized pyridoxal phosphate-containing UPF0001 family protein
MSVIAENLARIRSSIPPHVTLVAVTKTQPPEAIREAYAAGQRHFGENYAQEWRDKAGLAGWIHTVDRLSLAEELSRRSAARGAVTRVLVEVNVGDEASKSGCAPPEVPQLARTVARLPGLELRGLMCIPPADEDPRPHFVALRRLRDGLGLPLPDLSMGMSGDYPIAIEEGATIVRVGTAIFGARPRG